MWFEGWARMCESGVYLEKVGREGLRKEKQASCFLYLEKSSGRVQREK